MAQWTRRKTTDLEIQGSNPCSDYFFVFFGRVVGWTRRGDVHFGLGYLFLDRVTFISVWVIFGRVVRRKRSDDVYLGLGFPRLRAALGPTGS